MNATVSIPRSTISEKLDWLEHRYWRFGQDESLSGHLHDLYNVDDEAHKYLCCLPSTLNHSKTAPT